jgi:hypothetical protein
MQLGTRLASTTVVGRAAAIAWQHEREPPRTHCCLPCKAAAPLCRGPRRSVVGVQPTVEHSDRIVETVGGADCYEGLTAADSAGAGKGVEGRERELCLRERELGLVA